MTIVNKNTKSSPGVRLTKIQIRHSSLIELYCKQAGVSNLKGCASAHGIQVKAKLKKITLVCATKARSGAILVGFGVKGNG